jgi:ATP-dependent Zn protease
MDMLDIEEREAGLLAAASWPYILSCWSASMVGVSREGAEMSRRKRKRRTAKGSASPQRLLEVAHHEAGHVVADLVHGIDIHGVHLRSDGEITGQAFAGFSGSKESLGEVEYRRRIESAVVSAFAGPEAEKLFNPNAPTGPCQSDFDLARLLLQDAALVPEDSMEDSLAALRQRAGELAGKEWHAVQTLAQKLVKVRQMSSTEIQQFVTPLLEAGEQR